MINIVNKLLVNNIYNLEAYKGRDSPSRRNYEMEDRIMKKVLAFVIVAALLTMIGLRYVNFDFIDSKAEKGSFFNSRENQEKEDSEKKVNKPIFDEEDESFSNPIYVSNVADSSGEGTKDSPCNIHVAIEKSKDLEGASILLMSGIYSFNSTILIPKDNNGTNENMKVLKACKDQDVVFDFSTESYSNDTSKNQKGVSLEGSFWHVEGIRVYGAADNGMHVSGSNNMVENCIFDSNKDTGLQISRRSGNTKKQEWPSNNTILNCTSRNNCDTAFYENADGFAAKLTCGDGNVFDGCIANNNIDDGWDLYAKKETGPIGVVTIKNCVSIRNGKTEDGRTKSTCDGNGFKLGGEGLATPHVVENCMAIQNLHTGFTDNNNPAGIKLINCTAFDNNTDGSQNNYSMYRCNNATITNCLSYTTNNTTDALMNLRGEYMIFFNNKEYHCIKDKKDVSTKDKEKQGDVLHNGISDRDFISTNVPPVGTDFHIEFRNADKTINTKGVGIISKKSLYYNFSTDGQSIGARLSN